MLANRWTKGFVILFALLFLSAWALQMEAWARAGGGGRSGGSIGSRGSRSGAAPTPYTAPRPSQPSPGYSTPYRPTTPPPTSQPSSFWRSFGGGMLGGLAGGFLFRSLFGGPSAYGGMGGGAGGGIGLFDILLLCGIGYLIYWYIKKKRLAAQTAGGYQSSATGPGSYQTQYPPSYDQPPMQPGGGDVEQGLANIRQFDPYFDEAKFQDMAMDLFFKTQGAWANRDMSPVRQLFTEEMFRILQNDVDQMKAEKKINRLENIAVRSVDITEAWQESGADYITARIYANLLDYNVDETSGQVIEGSKTDPVKFEEYWTFTRPVGNNPWQLSAIQQAPA
ncbi:MAG: Tim44 domain-containing protein [Deltaproteobacteria bacterium]|nr:Tim44 domain-containing protein [Deltaproteobacteria bacterium]